MFLYMPIKQNLNSLDLGCYITFGIAAFRLGWGLCERVAAVDDVSPSFYEAASLAATFTNKVGALCESLLSLMLPVANLTAGIVITIFLRFYGRVE